MSGERGSLHHPAACVSDPMEYEFGESPAGVVKRRYKKTTAADPNLGACQRTTRPPCSSPVGLGPCRARGHPQSFEASAVGGELANHRLPFPPPPDPSSQRPTKLERRADGNGYGGSPATGSLH